MYNDDKLVEQDYMHLRLVRETDRTCEAMQDITIGGSEHDSCDASATLFCDLLEGHETLHWDQTDDVWWRIGERDGRDAESADSAARPEDSDIPDNVSSIADSVPVHG